MIRSVIAAWVFSLILVAGDLVAQGRPSLEDQPGLAEFAAYVGETFIVYGGQGVRRTEALTLTGIEDLSLPDQPVEQFRLVFVGDSDSTLTKDSYHAEHPEAGRFLLFLEPGPVTGDTQAVYVDMVLLKEAL